jgi:hypothetical protein
MKPRSFEQVHTEEKDSRKEEITRLNGLSGFQELSEKQQQFILVSLYVQDRAERGTDVVSATKISDVPEKFISASPHGSYIRLPDFGTQEEYDELNKYLYENPNEYKYKKSQDLIQSEYCHSVVAKLESLKDSEASTAEWIDPGPIDSLPELYELISLAESQYSYPFVLEIAYDEVGRNNMRRLQHTAVLLGKDDSGYVVWEKAGLHLPFQLAPLEQVYHAYMETGDYVRFPSRFWRLRPLKV